MNMLRWLPRYDRLEQNILGWDDDLLSLDAQSHRRVLLRLAVGGLHVVVHEVRCPSRFAWEVRVL